jgi:hypothetical protein
MLPSNLRRREFWSLRSSESSEAAAAQIALQQQFGRDLKSHFDRGFPRHLQPCGPSSQSGSDSSAGEVRAVVIEAFCGVRRARLEGRPPRAPVQHLTKVPLAGQRWHETPAEKGRLL